MDAVPESGRKGPVIDHQVQLSTENERVNIGLDGRTHLARPNKILRRERVQGKQSFFCSVGYEHDWKPYPVDRYRD